MSERFEVRNQRLQDWVWTAKSLLYHPDCDENMYKVYCGLSAHADNRTQEAFPSLEHLSKELHISRRTVIRSVQKLEAFEFIAVERVTGNPNIYTLLAIPEKSPPRGKGRSGTGKPDEPPPPEEPFDWDQYLLGMAKNKQRHIKIIGYFFQRKKLTFSNAEQVGVAIDEHVKAAAKLKSFEKGKIVWAMDKLDRDFPAWTLNTVVKELVK